MNASAVTPVTWLLAATPVVVLFATALVRRIATHHAALAVAVLTAVIGVTAFDAGGAVLGVAVGKGLWLGLWILCVVWPALLLYGVARAGGLEQIGRTVAALLPRRRERLLLLAWVLPSFIQGVAGFGTPIAVSAPLLLAAGWSPVRAVVYPLIGYHWSVTFGSMGSSFYMAALTAELGLADQTAFALLASTALAIHCVVAGALVLWLDGGLAAVREGLRMLVVAGAAMGGALVGVALVVPAVASLAAGTVGLATVLVLSSLRGADRRTRPILGASADHPVLDEGQRTSATTSIAAFAPYLWLLLTALPVFLVPASRSWVRANLLVAPGFGETATGLGWVNAAVTDYTPIALLGHPGSYVALAAALGYLTYRAVGLLGPGGNRILRPWLASLPKSSTSIASLAVLATVMADTGMVAVLAEGIAGVARGTFPALSPVVGGIGSFITGSTTTSNALFAGLQLQIAERLDVAPTVLLAAQTVGGNVGNAVAPVVILIGATTIGDPDVLGTVLRRCLPAAGVLFAVAALITLLRV
ncbi:L-lactate permease [Euzebya sp.]|uniref:L-lactate permease n=1 Tax=Euzebya sp. TaxID=1971409 RepID=UPI003519A5BA